MVTRLSHLGRHMSYFLFWRFHSNANQRKLYNVFCSKILSFDLRISPNINSQTVALFDQTDIFQVHFGVLKTVYVIVDQGKILTCFYAVFQFPVFFKSNAVFEKPMDFISPVITLRRKFIDDLLIFKNCFNART